MVGRLVLREAHAETLFLIENQRFLAIWKSFILMRRFCYECKDGT